MKRTLVTAVGILVGAVAVAGAFEAKDFIKERVVRAVVGGNAVKAFINASRPSWATTKTVAKPGAAPAFAAIPASTPAPDPLPAPAPAVAAPLPIEHIHGEGRVRGEGRVFECHPYPQSLGY